MDGYEATRHLRENQLTNHIPIILLTARGDRESRLNGWQEKADEYLTKPFDREELKIRINSLLEIRNILRKRFSENLFQAPNFSIENNKNNPLDLETGRNEQQRQFVKKVDDALENIYTDSSTSIGLIADNIYMSERQMFRKLKSILDMTPSEYLRRFRLEKSKAILRTGKSVNYTTIEVGFATQSNFAKCFKAQYGMSPSEFKNSSN